MKASIYHNEKCSKSNAALQLLLEHGMEVEVVNYLETPFTSEQLQSLLNLLGIEAKALIRFGEPLAKELGVEAEDFRDRNEWITLIIKHPILMERPIVLINNQAVIARPPEIVVGFIESMREQESDI